MRDVESPRGVRRVAPRRAKLALGSVLAAAALTACEGTGADEPPRTRGQALGESPLEAIDTTDASPRR